MDRIEIYQEIRSMQIIYSFHFVFYLILGIEHLLIIIKLFWNNIIHKKIIIAFSIIDLVILFYPIIPLVLMYRIILKKNLTKIFRFISLILIILTPIIGLIINIFYWVNVSSTTIFFKECPYNLKDLSAFTTDENFSNKCGKRRCVLESKNDDFEDYPYNYICNYNSQGDFEVDPTKQYPVTEKEGSIHYIRFLIQCEQKNNIDELFKDNNNINNQIYNYLQKCWNNNDIKGFYLCQRYEYPNKFNINTEYKCPKNDYNTILYIAGIFSSIFDILLVVVPWSFDYKSYSTLLSFDNIEDENVQINENNNNQARHNETNTSSHNRNGAENNQNENGSDNNNLNNNIGSENNERNEYIHQPTETIIIAKDTNTNNNSSNFKSNDRINSGFNSNDMSKSNFANNNNSVKKKNKKNENIGSLISQSESQNMISKTSEKENESEDSKSMGKKNLLLRKNNFIDIGNNINNNENEEINFNNNIIYDQYGQYHNNNDEDEKEVVNKEQQNNCLIKNKNININNIILNNKNKKQESLNNKPKIKIILTNKENNNINTKETNNIVKTTNIQGNEEEKKENNKNNNSESGDEIKKFEQIVEDIHENYHTRTPKKEIRTLKFNFSQVLTNVRESDNFTLFKNTNGSIIKEERKEETKKSIKGIEEEKNNCDKSKNDTKRINLSMLTPLKLRNISKNKENKNDQKIKSFVKNYSQSSLIVDSNKSSNNSRLKENN